jgi:hypothetical protein
MSNIIQYDLFEEKPTEVDELRIELAAVRLSSDKVRRKLFSENGELKKRLYALENNYEILVRNICQKK